MVPTTVSSTVSLWTPTLPPNKGIRSYSVMTGYVETSDVGGARSQITEFVQGGGPPKPGGIAIAEGPGVTAVHADYAAFSATADFVFIVDIFE
jgi:hypothetical protein